MPRKKGAKVTLADVVREFGPVGGAKKLSPKRAHVAGLALKDMFPMITGAAGSSLAQHMYQAQLEGKYSLEELVEALQEAFPALVPPEPEELAKPAPPPPAEKFERKPLERPMKDLTAMDVNRKDYPPFARPRGDVAEDPNYPPLAYSEPKMPNKKAVEKMDKGGGRDRGYGRGGGTGSRHMSLRKALTGQKA